MINNDKFVFETEASTCIHRAGIKDLLNYLSDKTDFYTAPASTKYHGSFEGGLVKHSLSVYDCFWRIAPQFGFYNTDGTNLESAAIVCLFHDICKANFYTTSYRNVKDEETGKWMKMPYYTIDEKLAYGSHGAKSVFLLQEFIHLTPEEAIAVHNHLGAYNNGTYEKPGQAYEQYKLAWLLHVADEASTFIEKI